MDPKDLVLDGEYVYKVIGERFTYIGRYPRNGNTHYVFKHITDRSRDFTATDISDFEPYKAGNYNVPSPPRSSVAGLFGQGAQAAIAADYAAALYGLKARRLEDYLPACECGSDKVGSPRHSTWCPKHV